MSTATASPARRSRAEMIETTTRALIATARTAFADRGFGEVSLDGLAAAAGMTRGAVHHHFGNKAGLFEAVLREVDAEISEELKAVAAVVADPWTGFRQSYHVYLDALLRPDRCRIIFQDAPAVLGMKAVDILMESGFAELVADIGRLMAAGRMRGGDAEAMAQMLNGATVSLAFWVADDPGEGRRERAHAMLDTLFDGIAGG